VTLTRPAHVVLLAWGWRRAAIAFGAGAATTLTLPPFEIWPIGFLTFPIAVWLIDGSASARYRGVAAAAAAGWCFGFGYFLAGLYWIGNAFLVDAKTFGWLMPIAIAGLPAVLALYTALGFALARAIWARGSWRILSFALALTISEWLRGHLLTGFPWNTFGYALAGPLALAQSVAWIGIWGLTFTAVAAFATPAALADDRAETKRRWIPLASAILLLALLAGLGAWRLARHPTEFVDGVRLRIMQPNIPQDEKFSYAAKDQIVARYLALSDRATGPQHSGMRDVTHLIWPESAFPFFLVREAGALAQIASLLPPGAVLITGAARPADNAPPARPVRAYNSVYVIDHEGLILSVYDKVHLVPFGEYLPFQPLLERFGLMQLTKLPGGFLSGDRYRSYSVPGAPRLVPLICYEIIFPDETVPAGERPGWLLNVTNDAWFGLSPGPYQHFQQARVRAIAEGLPVVRAANTGISAVIDPVGRVIASLPLGTEGVLDTSLPRQIDVPPYRRAGDTALALFLVALFLLILRRRQ
jgi:apolipoprotein N-acyltransferase